LDFETIQSFFHFHFSYGKIGKPEWLI